MLRLTHIALMASLALTQGLVAQSATSLRGPNSAKELSEGLDDLAQQIATRLTQNQKRRIAVLEFVDLKANVTDLGRYCSEKLITRLFQSNKFTVVERNLLNKVIAEQKLSLSAIIDPASAQKLGKVLGVDSIAVGSISDLGKRIDLNARLISTETGEVFSAADVTVLKDDTVCSLLGGCGSNAGSPEKSEVLTQPIELPKSIRQVGKNFVFLLHPCSRRETTVTCELDITNIDQDRSLTLNTSWFHYGDSRAIDQFNTEHKATEMELGGSGRRSLANTSMIKDIAVKARIYFENVGSDVSKFSLVQLIANDSPMGFFNVQFRDVPVITPGLSATRAPTALRSELMYQGNYFTSTLNRCRRSGASVICEFTVLNHSTEDRKFQIIGNWPRDGSRLHDNLGNTKPCGRAEIANSGRKGDPEIQVVAGLSVRAKLYCEDVAPDATTIAKLTVEMCSEGCGAVDFRNVPIVP